MHLTTLIGSLAVILIAAQVFGQEPKVDLKALNKKYGDQDQSFLGAAHGHIERVIGPTTVVLTSKGRTFTLPLSGLLSPAATTTDKEIRRALENKTNYHLKQFVANKDLWFSLQGTEAEPESSVIVYTKSTSESVNKILLSLGEAKFDKSYKEYSKDLFAKTELVAKASGKGCWSKKEDLEKLAIDPRYLVESSPPQPDRPRVDTIVQHAKPDDLIAGGVYYLHNADHRDPVGAAGLFGYEEMMTLYTAKDDIGLKEMIKNRQIAVLNDDTKVKFIETERSGDYSGARVRILSGPYEGESMWVLPNWLMHRREVPRKAKK